MKTENVIVAALFIAVISMPLAEAKDLPTSINQPRIIAQNSEIPTEAKNHLNAGVERYEVRDFKGAIKEYTQAIRIKPDYAKAYTNRGAARAELKDFEGAIKDHTQAIWLAPRDATSYSNRGIVYFEMKNYPKAIEL
ncbi:tetratricopeptide repeat protein [Nostoc sp. FACHB-110]|uniref:tetratricopeptide repeat protein n=1 Tax=Nostoc sp. FACHB-110 TaxID=2692834 RepID=UPI001683E981|nr:tetratricopeptide repeat protein [Nostoc sp. FACHB-110]MBD2441177.1 tetratricopeptide repeat protein [Nostoc sp. FACHB-110]